MADRHIKRITARALALLLAVAWMAALLPAGPTGLAEGAPVSFRWIGTFKNNANVTEAPAKKSTVLEKAAKGDTCEILGLEEKYYRVRFGEQVGYVGKGNLTAEARLQETPVPEALCEGLKLVDPIPDRHEEYLLLEGEMTADEPIESVLIYIWDERLYQVEYIKAKAPDKPAAKLGTEWLATAMPTNKLTGGRKTVVVEGVCGGDVRVLFRSTAYVCRDANEPDHITAKCKGVPKNLLDTKVSTAWVPTKSKPSLEITLPPDGEAAVMTMEWKVPPLTLTIEQLDGNGNLLSVTEPEGRFWSNYIVPETGTEKVRITTSPEKGALATLRVYGKDYPRHVVQQWDPMPEKLDILLVSTHQDDEILFFGGTIPYYSAREDTSIGVVYMADCGRIRYREALDGLWTCGLKYHPIFFGLEDFQTYNLAEARALWKEDEPVEKLVRVIRRYKPEVILTQDFDGEYGHAQHKACAQITAEALEAAAREDFDPDSAKEYGAWQVKKMYVHLYGENQIHMDWTQPLGEDEVVTPLFLAMEAYDKHRSQQAYFSMRKQGVTYDNTLFGLYYTDVGPDTEKNDFMENVR